MYYLTNDDKIKMKYINDKIFGKATLISEKNGNIEFKCVNDKANREAPIRFLHRLLWLYTPHQIF